MAEDQPFKTGNFKGVEGQKWPFSAGQIPQNTLFWTAGIDMASSLFR
jgi:hypothetical protein